VAVEKKQNKLGWNKYNDLCLLDGKQLLKQFVCVVLLCLTYVSAAQAQHRIELGGFVGASYYNGDLNPSIPFLNSNFAFGGIGRYVFTDRIALKGTATIGRISGSYPDGDVRYYEYPDEEREYNFSRRIGDVSAQIEFNFLSYDHRFISNTVFSPYLSMGLATTVYSSASREDENEGTRIVLSLPFGFGVKYKVNDWVRIGAEWTFRKTFVDDLDYQEAGVIDPSDPYRFNEQVSTHNNDWYSFAGVYVTFSMFRRKNTCQSGF